MHTYKIKKINIWTNLKRHLGLGQVFQPPLSFNLALLTAALLQHPYTPAPLTPTPSCFSLMVPLNSFFSLLFLKSLEFFLVLHHLTCCCIILYLQLSIILLRSIHSPITVMSSFLAQLIIDSSFNLYKGFNTNYYSIFKYHRILRLFSFYSL